MQEAGVLFGRPSSFDLEKYDQVIWLIVEQLFRKNASQEKQSLSEGSIKKKLLDLIRGLIVNQRQDFVIDTLKKIEKRLSTLEYEQQVKVQTQSVRYIGLSIGEVQRIRSEADRLEGWKIKLLKEDGEIDWKIVELAIRSFCLKPHSLSLLYSFLFTKNQTATIEYLLSRKVNVKLPSAFLTTLLQEFNSHRIDLTLSQVNSFSSFLGSQVDRKTEPHDFRDSMLLLKEVLKFNSSQQRHQSTIKILRSLRVTFKQQPELIEQINQLARSVEQ